MVEKLIISQPLGMAGAFLVFVTLPLLYEVRAFLRSRSEEAAPAPAPAPVPAAGTKKRRRL